MGFRIVNHLEPLANAANFTQSSFCRLDEVLIVFGYLTRFFSTLIDPLDDQIKSKVMESMNSRLSNPDLSVMIAAALLNPFVGSEPFNIQLPTFSAAAIHNLLENLYFRFFFRKPEPGRISREYHDFVSSSDRYLYVNEQVETLTHESFHMVRFFYIFNTYTVAQKSGPMF